MPENDTGREYVPTTEEVRRAYTMRLDNRDWETAATSAFDRWLATLTPAPVGDVSAHGCDNCGKTQTRVTTPGGFRSCDECFGGAH